MMDLTVLKIIISVVAAYCLGSISWAYVIGRWVANIDMTEVGDGRIGTAFAIRRLGMGWGVAVGVLDFLKGVAAVVLPLILDLSMIVVLAAGLAVVAGHNWSVFLGFKGGRGAATSFGVLAVLALLPMLVTIAIMAFPYLKTRRSPFIKGFRRTTLLYGIFLIVVAIVWWLDIALEFMPALPWLTNIPLMLIALPPGLLLLNLAGRPQARRGFDNQTRLG
jgi:acyl-phosphate glycerol 3-phosphate acyltransferase